MSAPVCEHISEEQYHSSQTCHHDNKYPVCPFGYLSRHPETYEGPGRYDRDHDCIEGQRSRADVFPEVYLQRYFQEVDYHKKPGRGSYKRVFRHAH